MLTPNEILKLTYEAQGIAFDLQNNIIQQMVARMTARLGRQEGVYLTAADMWQIETLKQSGMLMEDINKEIAKAFPKEVSAINSAFKKAALDSWKYDTAIMHGSEKLQESAHYVDLLQRNAKNASNAFENFTRTTVREYQRQFINACDNAYFMVASGAEGWTSAYKNALDAIVSGRGNKAVFYNTRRDYIETATIRALRTGIVQTNAEITVDHMNETGWDVVLVSQHMGSRPSHAAWQGKFYSLRGATKGLKLLSDATGYGTAEGLCGINCRHSFGPGNLGYNPYEKIDRKKSDELYANQQTQRGYERDIRNLKSELMDYEAALKSDPADSVKAVINERYDKAAAKLTKAQKEYAEFSESVGLKTQSIRTTIGGWTKKTRRKQEPQEGAQTDAVFGIGTGRD